MSLKGCPPYVYVHAVYSWAGRVSYFALFWIYSTLNIPFSIIWMDFLSSSCQTIICVVKLDSICYTRKPNGRWPQRCLSRRPPLHRLSLLRFTPPQIIFMCTWLAAIMCRPAWPGVTVPVNKAVTPVVLKKIIKTDFTTAPVITHGRCFMKNMCAALWASCHSSRTMPGSSWSYF